MDIPPFAALYHARRTIAMRARLWYNIDNHARAYNFNEQKINGQSRAVRQEPSARDFPSRRGLEGAGVLCVLQTFQTDGSAKKIRRRPKPGRAGLPSKMEE
ncbi:MAG: hypothetical protein U0M25_08805 [Oscillospiraceae bacterium]|nr:hypothetical protein [Oscillospiraceae bacterium]